MKDTLALYRLADRKETEIIRLALPVTGSMSIQDGEGRYCIGIDEQQLPTSAGERTHLAHELGHCCTGSFYHRYATRDVRQQHENRADKWAVRRLVPEEELDTAVADGHTEVWDLADFFGVTEDFIKKAVCFYTHGNLATDLYP